MLGGGASRVCLDYLNIGVGNTYVNEKTHLSRIRDRIGLAWSYMSSIMCPRARARTIHAREA